MPNVADYSTENDWMGACVPKMVNEGKDQDQAVAACMSMWREKSAVISRLSKKLLAKNWKAESLQDQIENVYESFRAQFPSGEQMATPAPMPMDCYIDEIYPDYVIACMGGKEYQVSYSTDAQGNLTFAPMAEWVEVEEQTTYVPVKAEGGLATPGMTYTIANNLNGETATYINGIVYSINGEVVNGNSAKVGRRNNSKDQQRIQSIHDYAVENGAMCKKSSGKSEAVEELVRFGGTLKAVKLDDGSVKFYGPLITFGDAVKTDLTGDFFDNVTDYGDATESDVYFNHRMPITIDGVTVDYKAKLGKATLTKTDEAIFAETILKARNAYEKAIIDAGLAGQLGWSSGTAGHLVDRETVGKAYHIKQWILGLDASLTPTPAEPRNQVTPLKSINSVITSASGMTDTGDQTKQAQITKENDMNESELKALLESNNKTLVDTMKAEAKSAAKEAFTEMLDGLPEVKAKLNGKVEVTQDPADVPFKNMGENLSAIAKRVRSQAIHPRLKGLAAWEIATAEANGDKEGAARAYKAALGSNEGVPSQGEFLLEPTITQTLLQNIHEKGVLSKDARNLPVGPNSNSGWIPGVDETSRATGSRWGGVRGYHAAEAASMTASQPKFRKINWELHKIYVLQYATDEMLNDVGLLNAVIEQSSMEELDWTFNNDLMNGIGGDRPVGILLSSALISFARAATGAIGHSDIVAMWARLSPRAKKNAKWYISSDVHPQLDQLTFTSGTTGILSPYIGYGPDGVMRIYGRPVEETEFNPALGTLGDIMVGDVSQYITWEKNAVEAASSIHVQFLTDQTAFRYIYRADGQTALNSALTPANGGNTQSDFVALLATT